MNTVHSTKFTYQYPVVTQHFVCADNEEQARALLNLEKIGSSSTTSAEITAIWENEAERHRGHPVAIYESPEVSGLTSRTILLPKGP